MTKWVIEEVKEPYRTTYNIIELPSSDVASPILTVLYKMPIAVAYSEEVAKEIVESHNAKVEVE